MLKFDLPYRNAKNYSYIKGELRLQVYACVSNLL